MVIRALVSIARRNRPVLNDGANLRSWAADAWVLRRALAWRTIQSGRWRRWWRRTVVGLGAIVGVGNARGRWRWGALLLLRRLLLVRR